MSNLVSMFENSFSKMLNDLRSLEDIISLVKSTVYRHRIESLRNGTFDKQKLPAFTPSGEFRGGKEAQNLHSYSHTLCLDFDKAENLTDLLLKLYADPYLHAIFISPSGNGCKFFIKVESGAGEHRKAYKIAMRYYAQLLGVNPDPKCININRICYVSFDPQAKFIKECDTRAFPWKYWYEKYLKELEELAQIMESPALLPSISNEIVINEDVKSFLISFTNNKESYVNNNRNNYLFLLACNCNRYGVNQQEALAICEQVWRTDNKDLSGSELHRSVRSAYNNKHEHGIFSLPKSVAC